MRRVKLSSKELHQKVWKTVVRWFTDAKNDRVFKFLYLAVILSFAFYLPIVVLSDAIPLIGMLMLPKTVMYIWIICMFLKAQKREAT